MTFNKIIFAAALCLSLTTAPITSHAQEQETAPKYPTFEGNGLYDAGSPHNLGADIFHQSKRSEILKLISSSSKSGWHALDNLVVNTLLTTTELSTMQHDLAPSNGNDLFTERLNKLLDLGLYNKAYELYSTIKDAQTSEQTSKAGVMAMLYNNQRGKACLEVKISLPKYPAESFWREMNAYCTITHSEEENKDYWTIIEQSNSAVSLELLKNKDQKNPYSEDILSSYSPVELAIATSQNAIDISKMPYDQYAQISPKHIDLLLLQPELSDENRIILSGYAALYGTITAQELESVFVEVSGTTTKQKNSGILEILALYEDAKDAILGSTKAKKIDQAFKLAETYGEGLLIPFIPFIQQLDADDLSLNQLKRALTLFILSNTDVPKGWLNDLVDIKLENDTDKKTLSNIIFATRTLSESVDKDDIVASQKFINDYLLSNAYASGLNYIIENIDSTENNSDKVFNIYENGFDLAAKKSYTMPPFVVTDELSRTSKNQNIAQTVLLASIIANKKSGHDVNLEVLEHVVNALIQIGYKKQARQILAQAILEIE